MRGLVMGWLMETNFRTSSGEIGDRDIKQESKRFSQGGYGRGLGEAWNK